MAQFLQQSSQYLNITKQQFHNRVDAIGETIGANWMFQNHVKYTANILLMGSVLTFMHPTKHLPLKITHFKLIEIVIHADLHSLQSVFALANYQYTSAFSQETGLTLLHCMACCFIRMNMGAVYFQSIPHTPPCCHNSLACQMCINVLLKIVPKKCPIYQQVLQPKRPNRSFELAL